MFPLPRMLEYGNQFIRSEIKKVQGGSLNLFVLMSNGDVWVAGSNLYGELGLGQFTGWNGMTPEWTKVLTGVDDIWARGPNSTGLVFLKDGKYYYQGQGTAIARGGNIYTAMDTGLDVVLNSDPGSVVRQIMMYNNSIHALIRFTDGTDRVYSIGQGYMLGNGNNTASTVFVESTAITAISTNIIDISCNANALYFRSYTGKSSEGIDYGQLYGTGMNARQQLDTSATGTFISTPKLLLNSVYSMNAGNECWIANYNGSILYGQGNNSLNSISTSSSTTFNIPTQLGFYTVPQSLIYSASSTTGVYNPVNNVMQAIGSIYNLDSTKSGTSKAWVQIYNPSTYPHLDNYCSGYNTSAWGKGGDWFFSKETASTGIVGIAQTNGSFRFPNFGN